SYSPPCGSSIPEMAITSERGKRKSVDLELSATYTVWWLLMPKGYFVFLQLNKQIKLAKRALYYLRVRSANVG
ncbi:MAG: hypothetical protein ACK54O_04705, partial [Pseudanabaena sp.]